MRKIIPISFIAAVLATAPLAAQPAPARAGTATGQGDEAIVVTGQKESRQAIQDFVGALTKIPSYQQLSRFEHSVCPAVYGLPKAQADAVANRIRLIAKTIGIVVGGEHCVPNVLVVATSDKLAFLEELRKRRADDFGITDSQIHALEKQPGPAAAWQIQGPPMTADGQDLDVDPTVGQVVNRTIAGSSRITEPVRPQFDGAMVVIERKALLGLTITQLADYAAIRLLTGADPSHFGNSGAPTILHVLEVPIGGTAPITMTQWDFAFLRGYYDARRNLHTSAQRSSISDSMTKDLHRPQHK
jgi:hypothetical protein